MLVTILEDTFGACTRSETIDIPYHMILQLLAYLLTYLKYS